MSWTQKKKKQNVDSEGKEFALDSPVKMESPPDNCTYEQEYYQAENCPNLSPENDVHWVYNEGPHWNELDPSQNVFFTHIQEKRLNKIKKNFKTKN